MRRINTKRLMDLMFERQMFGKTLAQQAGISTGALSHMLKSGVRAQLVTVAKLAKALDVSPYELIVEE